MTRCLRLASRATFGMAALVVVGTGSQALAGPIDIGPYLQDARPDGAVVAWESEPPSAGAVVVETRTGSRRFSAPLARHHEVRIAGLASGHYRYRVVDGVVSSPPAELATAATGSRFTFLVAGDTRDADEEHRRVVAAMQCEAPDLILHVGDMVRAGGDDALWRRFFAIEQPLLGSIPLYPAVGNHELIDDPDAAHFHRYFDLPDERAESWYRFRYSNSLFVVLDGNRSGSPAQTQWLRRTLDGAAGDSAIRHVFAFVHQPPLSDGVFCGTAPDESPWLGEFERHRVRAVFSGHEHNYERLAHNGIRYFVTGGGGAYLIGQRSDCPQQDQAALRRFRAVHHFLRVRVAGDRATLDAITADGEVFDTVALHQPPAVSAPGVAAGRPRSLCGAGLLPIHPLRRTRDRRRIALRQRPATAHRTGPRRHNAHDLGAERGLPGGPHGQDPFRRGEDAPPRGLRMPVSGLPLGLRMIGLRIPARRLLGIG